MILKRPLNASNWPQKRNSFVFDKKVYNFEKLADSMLSQHPKIPFFGSWLLQSLTFQIFWPFNLLTFQRKQNILQFVFIKFARHGVLLQLSFHTAWDQNRWLTPQNLPMEGQCRKSDQTSKNKLLKCTHIAQDLITCLQENLCLLFH